jgi:hypothetical protein
MQLRSYLRAVLLGSALIAYANAASAQKSVPGMIVKDVEHAGRDLVALWTSPFDAKPNDILAGLFLIGSAVAISPIDDDVDRWAVRNADSRFFDALEPFRKGGALYTGSRLAPVAGALYVTGIITKRQGLRDAVAGCGVSWGANNVIRHQVAYRLVGRERPDPTRGDNPPPAAEPGDQYHFDIPNRDDWGWNSWPGGHIANIVGCVSFWNNRFHMGFVEPVLYALAGAVWIARTADRAHWTSDQFLGTVLGYAIGKEIAHRQVKREAQRTRDGGIGAAAPTLSPSDGLFVARTGEAVRVGWQRRF